MTNLIDYEKCIRCRLCIEVCPSKVIGTDKKGNTFFIPEREHICIKCGQCMAICSNNAIHIEGFDYGKNIKELPYNNIDYENFMNFLANRRSVRNFKDKPVNDETVEKVLKSLRYAPFGASPEKVNITVVNNRKIIEEALPYIERFLNDLVKMIKNPLLSGIIKMKEGVETYNTVKNHLYPIAKAGNYKLKYGDRITRGAPAIFIFHAEKTAEEHTHNSLIYATYLMLTAQSLGLGTTMIGLVPPAVNHVKEVKRIFNIPENHEAIMSVIAGYPKYKYKSTVERSYNYNIIK